jgi:hypothetical protein
MRHPLLERTCGLWREPRAQMRLRGQGPSSSRSRDGNCKSCSCLAIQAPTSRRPGVLRRGRSPARDCRPESGCPRRRRLALGGSPHHRRRAPPPRSLLPGGRRIAGPPLRTCPAQRLPNHGWMSKATLTTRIGARAAIASVARKLSALRGVGGPIGGEKDPGHLRRSGHKNGHPCRVHQIRDDAVAAQRRDEPSVAGRGNEQVCPERSGCRGNNRSRTARHGYDVVHESRPRQSRDKTFELLGRRKSSTRCRSETLRRAMATASTYIFGDRRLDHHDVDARPVRPRHARDQLGGIFSLRGSVIAEKDAYAPSRRSGSDG